MKLFFLCLFIFAATTATAEPAQNNFDYQTYDHIYHSGRGGYSQGYDDGIRLGDGDRYVYPRDPGYGEGLKDGLERQQGRSTSGYGTLLMLRELHKR